MAKSISKFATAVALVALCVTSVHADEPTKRKRKGFFESIFGSHEGSSRQRREARRQWWENDGPRFIFGNGTKLQFGDGEGFAGDPEPLPGLGMGNLTYAYPKLPAVFDSSFASRLTTTTEADSIRLVLSDKTTSIRAEQLVKDAVLQHYQGSGFKPVWLENGKISSRAKDALKILQSSGDEGLEPVQYLPAVLSSFDDADAQVEGSVLAAAQFDVGLTVALVTYAKHVSGGVFDPAKLSLYHDLKPEPVAPGVALRVLATTPYLTQYLDSIVPQHSAYKMFRDELRRLNGTAVSKPEPFPAGKRVKVGQRDPRVLLLRSRLLSLGYLDEIEILVNEGNADVLDKALSKALKAFQQSNGIAQTGALDQATVKMFNPDRQDLDRERLITNMERLRWLPRNLGKRHVFVNQAAFEVDVIDSGKPIWKSKVIVGRPLTQTAVFSDEMETVVFNPSWGVPQSIIINEYLPKLRRDPSYFDRIGFKVLTPNGKVVPSRAINWRSVGKNTGIGVQQPPGNGNALGEIKFLFPNEHSIYMHDTPTRNLFAETQRAFSHGCVRVENPREFATILLGWDRLEVDENTDSGRSQSVALPAKVPVHLTYFTAWPDENGKILYFSDFYERDLTLARARETVSKVVSSRLAAKTVQVSAKPAVTAAD